jgi:hypothetical protein
MVVGGNSLRNASWKGSMVVFVRKIISRKNNKASIYNQSKSFRRPKRFHKKMPNKRLE